MAEDILTPEQTVAAYVGQPNRSLAFHQVVKLASRKRNSGA
ncbi:hypothetical protein [Verrucomicrobium sp. BvORR106]|nr:hypothetical protein [Verrucomicrobium sp. BvORR106]